MATVIDLDELTREQLVQLARHYEEALNATIATHNELVARLVAADPKNGPQADTLNAWSGTVNAIMDASAAEIRRIAAPATSSKLN